MQQPDAKGCSFTATGFSLNDDVLALQDCVHALCLNGRHR